MKNTHLIPLNFQEGSIPLFIIPGSGGKTDRFIKFGKLMRNFCTVYGVEMLGTQVGEIPLSSIPDIAQRNISWIKELVPEGPYRFVAHSFGALVMFEMVKQLEKDGEHIDFVVILDQRLESKSGFTPEIGADRMISGLLELAKDYFEAYNILKETNQQWGEELWHILKTCDFMEYVSQIRKFMTGKIPEESSRIDYICRLIYVRFFVKMIPYYPQGKIKSEIIVIKSSNSQYQEEDETLGWSVYGDNVNGFIVPGNHWDMIRTWNVCAIVTVLKERIQRNRAYNHEEYPLINQS